MTGKAWMISHLIDDEDLAFMQREFVSYAQAMDYYGLSGKPQGGSRTLGTGSGVCRRRVSASVSARVSPCEPL